MVDIVNIEDTVRRTVSPQVGLAPNMAASSDAFGGQVGRALQGLGAEMSQAANFFIAEQKQRQDFETSTRYIEQQSVNATLLDESARAAEGTTAKDFTKSYMAEVRKRNEAFLATVPESDRPRWKAKLAAAEAQLSQQALTTEFRTYDKFQVDKIDSTTNEFLKGIDQAPEALQTYMQMGESLIDQTNWSDGVKTSMKKKWRENAQVAYWDAIRRNNPEEAARRLGADMGPVANTVNKIIGVESGNDPDADNPRSSASGLGQFIDSTWLATVRRYRPDLAGKSDAALLALKNDRALGREMTTRYVEENAKALSAAGISVTEGNLYLAHFAGPGGAVAVLKAADDTPVSAILGADVIKANPFLAGKTAGYLKQWASSKMGHAVAPDPNTSDLSYETLLKVRDGASRAYSDKLQQDAADQTNLYNSQLNDLKLGVSEGRYGADYISAARQSWLTDFKDIDAVENLLKEREKTTADATMFSNKIGTPGATWNPFDKADTDAVEAGVKQLGGTPQAAFDVWSKTGILAPSGAVALRGGLISTDPQRVLASATLAGNMLASNPNAFAGVTGQADLEKAGSIFNHMVNERGLTPEEAAQRIAQENDPQYRAKIKVTDQAVADFQKDLFKSDQTAAILDSFDPGYLSSEPGMPVLPAQRQALLSDFVEAAADAYRMTGDPEAAKAVAITEIKKQWGVSRGTLVKFPPEKAYPSSGSEDDPHGYVYAQAAQDVNAALNDYGPAGPTGKFKGMVMPGNIDLATRPQVKNEDGSISTVRSMSFEDKDGYEVLIPTVIGNRVVSNEEAVQHYYKTGQHLGKFKGEDGKYSAGEAADAYAQALHTTQETYFAKKNAARTVAPDDVFLVPLPGGQTAEAFRQGKLPPYQLVYRHTDPASGQTVFDVLPGKKGFVPDVKKAQDAVAGERLKKLEEENAVARYQAWQDQKKQYDLQVEMQRNILDMDKQLQMQNFGNYDPTRGPQMTPPPDLPPEPPMPPSLAAPPAAIDDLTGVPAPGFTEPFGIIP